MFKLPHPEPTTEHEAVLNGIALFEWNSISRDRVRFLVAQDLDNFSMSSSCHCVVGRTVGWDEHWDALAGFDNQPGVFADDTYGFDCGDTPWTYGDLERAWRAALSLPEPGPPKTCVYTDTNIHSEDILSVYHGMPDGRPTYICGFHEQSRGIPQGSDRAMLHAQHAR